MSLLELINNEGVSYASRFEKNGYNYTVYNFTSFPIKLQSLPYKLNALEPYISKETLYYHYHKHHQGYVDKLNNMIKMTKLNKETLRLSDLLSKKILREFPDIYNNAAQVWNHTFYWNSMSPSNNPMSLELKLLIHQHFGSYEKFKEIFVNKAKSHFGSGWVWLVKNLTTNKLEIIDTHDAFNPLTEGKLLPLMVLDVWEHAYYIDTRNDRNTYIENWFNIVNWDFVEKNLKISNKL